MKPSRYTFLIVPDHDGKNRRFSISRAGTLIILFTTILLITGMVFGLIYMFPKAVDYSRMKKDYNAVIGERSKVLALYRDLERLKEVERMVQQALGTNLEESDDVKNKLVAQPIDPQTPLGSATFIPSLIPVNGVVTQEMIKTHETKGGLIARLDLLARHWKLN